MRECPLRDLHDAAEVVRAKGGHVADGVEFYLAPASAEVASEIGIERRLANAAGAGAIALPPGAVLASAWGAVWCKKAKSRSAPPIVISKAAWAIACVRVFGFARRRRRQRTGRFICAPKNFAERAAGHRCPTCPKQTETARVCGNHGRFPPSVRGRVLFIDKDI